MINKDALFKNQTLQELCCILTCACKHICFHPLETHVVDDGERSKSFAVGPMFKCFYIRLSQQYKIS